jgi:hypothetical protein
MDIPLRAPRNRTAELQLILRLVAQGYVYWTSDQIPKQKLTGFLKKWEHYRLLADPPARSWRKQTGKANTHLVLEHSYNNDCPSNKRNANSESKLDAHSDSETEPTKMLEWILLGSQGKDGLGDAGSKPGVVKNATTKNGRILWMGYELIHQRKSHITAEGRLKTETTWTWRLPSTRFQEWEAHVIESAKQRNYEALQATFGILSRLPMFAGIRSQVYKLHSEANRMLKKFGGKNLTPLALPFATLSKIWE